MLICWAALYVCFYCVFSLSKFTICQIAYQQCLTLQCLEFELDFHKIAIHTQSDFGAAVSRAIFIINDSYIKLIISTLVLTKYFLKRLKLNFSKTFTALICCLC